jgi:hypothetical protein
MQQQLSGTILVVQHQQLRLNQLDYMCASQQFQHLPIVF